MKIQIFPLDFEGVKRIGIRPLGFERSFPSLMKKIPGSRWTPKEKCWHIPYSKQSYDELKRRLFGEGQIIALKTRPVPSPANKNARSEKHTIHLKHKGELIRLEERLRIQRYSHNTVKTYKNFFVQYLAFYPEQHPETLQKQDIVKFLLQSTKDKKWSDSTQNQAVNAIKFYYEKVLGQKRTYYELRPRKSRKLPSVFSEEEIKKLFRACLKFVLPAQKAPFVRCLWQILAQERCSCAKISLQQRAKCIFLNSKNEI